MKYPKSYNNSVSISNRKMGKKNEDIVLSVLRVFFNAKFENNENRKKLMDKGYKAYFSFYFQPEKKIFLYEIKDKLEYDVDIRRGGTSKRGSNEYTDCLYIPTKYLFEIDCKTTNDEI